MKYSKESLEPMPGEEDFERILEELQGDAVSSQSVGALEQDGRLLLDVIHAWNALKQDMPEEQPPELEKPTAPPLDTLLQEALLRYAELRQERGDGMATEIAAQPELTPPTKAFTQAEYARLLARVLSGEEPEIPE